MTTTYEQLERLTLGHLESFQTDLTQHDREWLGKNHGVPFIHMTRSHGTVLVGLYPADNGFWPAVDKYRPYIFGQCNRWHILKDSTGVIDFCPNEHVYHYGAGTGEPGNLQPLVRSITHAEAQQIRREFVRTVSAAWGR